MTFKSTDYLCSLHFSNSPIIVIDLRESAVWQTGNRHPWEQARLAIVQKILCDNIDKRKGQTLLDIGCGDSYVIRRLAKRFSTLAYIGVDTAFTPDIIAMRKKVTLQSNLTISFYPRLSLLDNKNITADFLLLLDVIEHIADDAAFLLDLGRRAFVKPHSLLLITVPAFGWLYSTHDQFLGHYRRYTLTNLKHCANKSGWQVINSGYFFSSLLILRTLQVLKEKIGFVNKAKGVSNWKASKTLDKAIIKLLYADFHVSSYLSSKGWNMPGLSTFALCKKVS